jgi:glutamine synthetase
VEQAHLAVHQAAFRLKAGQMGTTLTTADNAVTFRFALQLLARHANLHALFMPKPLRGINGNGMHFHQSLFYKSNGDNAFVDPGDEHGLSSIAKHFIARQLVHAQGMCAVVAPLVNSY